MVSAVVEIATGAFRVAFGAFFAFDRKARLVRQSMAANLEWEAHTGRPVARHYARETSAQGFGSRFGDWQRDFAAWGAEWVMRDEWRQRIARRFRWFAAAWFALLGSGLVAAGIVRALH